MPTVRAPKINARNGCSLATVINTTMSAMPAKRGKHQLPAGRDGLGQLGIGRQDGECRGHFFSCSVAREADNER